ncbi:MAG: hypothetical protein ACE360_11350 [Hyphomicrobiales bacterium]
MAKTLAPSDLTLAPEVRAQTVAGINVKIGVSVLCAVGSYAFWPSSLEWWGFATHSICLGGMSVTLLIGAVKSMVRLRRIEQTLAAYEALGSGPKGARLASDDALVTAGMLDAPEPFQDNKGSVLGKLFGGAS